MITQNVDSFIFGVDRYPEWFKSLNTEYLYNLAGELVGASISTSQGIIRVNVGDGLFYVQGRPVVVPKDAMERYGS